jgi:kanamycin kinase
MSRRVISEIPTGPVAVPDVITALTGGDTVTLVWRNELGG